jgi:hypothetical protein
MRELPETVRRKVFVHPVSKVPYGPIRIPHTPEKPMLLDGKLYDVIAEDEGGNYFMADSEGAVLSWDHETDDLTPLQTPFKSLSLNALLPRQSSWIPSA